MGRIYDYTVKLAKDNDVELSDTDIGIIEKNMQKQFLSLLTVAFIQLGMIVLEDGDVENYIERAL